MNEYNKLCTTRIHHASMFLLAVLEVESFCQAGWVSEEDNSEYTQQLRTIPLRGKSNNLSHLHGAYLIHVSNA